MNLKNTLLMAAFGLIMSAFTVQSMPGPGSQPAYSIVDLGTLGGNTFASAINSQGEVVGYSNLSNGNFRAFLYEKGVMHDIGFLGTNKNDQSYAYAINASGVVVGESEIDPTGTTHAFPFRLIHAPRMA